MCSVEGCEGKATRQGWCSKHYQRWRRHGDVSVVQKVGRKPEPPKPCLIEGCDRRMIARGLCHKHYQAMRSYGSPHGKGRDWTLTYNSWHRLLNAFLGSARDQLCVDCGLQAMDWSLKRGHEPLMLWDDQRKAAYVDDPGAYEARCRSCHVKYDRTFR